jgi:hypothetical protein
MRRFVHLGINPVGAVAGQPNPASPHNFYPLLENYLNQLVVNGDWYRYASQNYVLWTDADLADVARGVAGLTGFQNVYILVTEFTQAQCSGWMPRMFWDWLRKPRG